MKNLRGLLKCRNKFMEQCRHSSFLKIELLNNLNNFSGIYEIIYLIKYDKYYTKIRYIFLFCLSYPFAFAYLKPLITTFF